MEKQIYIPFITLALILTSCNSVTNFERASSAESKINFNKNSVEMQQVISKDGTTISFSKSGSGKPLLLVHGTTADHSRWALISPRFEKNYTVYSMDRRGRGGSGDAQEYNILREAEDVAAVVEAIGEEVFVLGHSYGGICSLEASLLTDKIRRLILYEPPVPTGQAYFPPNVADQIQALVDTGNPEAGLELFFRKVVMMPDNEFNIYRRQPVWQRRISLTHTIPREMAIEQNYTFVPERFTRLNIPVMFLLGGESPLIFKQAAEVVTSTLPDIRVVVLPGQQHVAMDTNPDLFFKEVSNFLQE